MLAEVGFVKMNGTQNHCREGEEEEQEKESFKAAPVTFDKTLRPYQAEEHEGELDDVGVGYGVQSSHQSVDDRHGSRDAHSQVGGDVHDNAYSPSYQDKQAFKSKTDGWTDGPIRLYPTYLIYPEYMRPT